MGRSVTDAGSFGETARKEMEGAQRQWVTKAFERQADRLGRLCKQEEAPGEPSSKNVLGAALQTAQPAAAGKVAWGAPGSRGAAWGQAIRQGAAGDSR